MSETRDTSTKALIETMSFPWTIQNGVEGFETYRDSHYVDKAEPREQGEECSVTIYKWLADAIVAALSREADLRRVAWGLANQHITKINCGNNEENYWATWFGVRHPQNGINLGLVSNGLPVLTAEARAAIDASMEKSGLGTK